MAQSQTSYRSAAARTDLRRLAIVLWAGDYLDAHRRMENGEGETYYAHEYALSTLADLSQRLDDVLVLSMVRPTEEHERVGSGFLVRGLGPGGRRDDRVAEALDEFAPTHVMVRTPALSLLRYLRSRPVRVATTLADSFTGRRLRDRVDQLRLRRALADDQVEWVGNHGVTSCRLLENLGVPPEKIIPWDWPHARTPADRTPQTAAAIGEPPTLYYVGHLSESKGVTDLVDAVAVLHRRGRPVRLGVVGRGDEELVRRRIAEKGIGDAVDLIGAVANSEIVSGMAAADVVVVPSRHAYPEGFPMTIYEALCSRSPLVTTDHPMFTRNLQDGETSLVVPEADPEALADAIARLLSDPPLYESLSVAAERTWERLQLPVTWGEMLNRWVDDDDDWLAAHSLAAHPYD